MNGTSSNASLASSKLGDLLARLPLNQADQWDEIEATAQALANDLRVKDGVLGARMDVETCGTDMRLLRGQSSSRLRWARRCCRKH